MDARQDFERFMQARKTASDQFVDGNFDPLRRISADHAPATIFGPKGDCVQGPERVNAANENGAKHFKPGGKNDFEVLHTAVDDHLAYWVGIQHSVVKMQGKDSPVPMDLRVTEIFRREDGAWKLVHRHADKLGAH